MSAQQSFTPIRTERFVNTIVGWYVRTREQVDLGPFRSAAAADEALQKHINHYRGLYKPRAGEGIRFGMEVHEPDVCAKSNCAICMEAHILSQSFSLSA